MVGVQLAEHRPHVVTERPSQGDLGRVDEDDLGPHLACGRGDLRADPTGADDGDPRGTADRLSEPGRVVDRAQDVDTVKVGAGHGEATGRRAGGEDGGVERDPVSAGELDGSAHDVHPERAVGDQLDVVLAVEAVGVHAGGLGGVLASEHGLRERGSLVGESGLVADEDDPPVEAGLPCPFGGAGTGEPGADDGQRRSRGRASCAHPSQGEHLRP